MLKHSLITFQNNIVKKKSQNLGPPPPKTKSGKIGPEPLRGGLRGVEISKFVKI